MLSKFSETKGFALSSAHFTQADTIIPNSGNSGDWDRYAYVLNNPINFNDPSGHAYNGKAIKAEKLFSDMTSSGNKNDLINDIKTNFGWTVGVGLSDAQVLNIWTAGLEIAAFIMKIDPTINPFEWIQNYLGNAVFYSSILQDVGITNASLVYPRSTIWLSDVVSSVGNIVHELGHVLDNNLRTGAGLATFTGGSIADGLLSSLGITPEGRRWKNKHKTKDTTYWFYQALASNGALLVDEDGVDYETYGNFGQADYFADAWEILIMDYDKGSVPTITETYINVFVQLLADDL